MKEIKHQPWQYQIFSRAHAVLLLVPICLLYIFVLIIPVLEILKQSLWDPAFSFHNYLEIYNHELYFRIFIRTLRVSVIVAITTLIVGYPIAFLMARSGGWRAAIIGASILLPLWTSILVRSFAWSVILSRNGIINKTLQATGLVENPIQFMFTETAVIIAMTHVLLPFMVLPLYAAIRTIPEDMILAANGMGAGRISILFEVIIPQTKPGITAGLVMVFVIALGFFITPALIGGSQAMMIASLISKEITSGGRWGLAAALSALLLLAAFLVVAAFSRVFATIDGKEATR